MLFNYEGIDFDINETEMSKDECIRAFKPIISIGKKFVDIAEINVENIDYAVILIEGGDENNYAEGTLEYAKELKKYGIETSLSDEDYGELDAINIYDPVIGCGYNDGSICLHPLGSYGKECDCPTDCDYYEWE